MRLSYTAVFCVLLFGLFFVGRLDAQNSPDRKTVGGNKTVEKKVMESENNKFGLSQLAQIAVPVDDLERATAFYRDKLGMNYLFTSGGMAFFDNGGIRLMLSKLDEIKSAAGGRFVVYYKVEDIQKGYKTLLERGVKFEEEPELAAKTDKFDLWLACFRDSENNNLCLMSEVARRK